MITRDEVVFFCDKEGEYGWMCLWSEHPIRDSSNPFQFDTVFRAFSHRKSVAHFHEQNVNRERKTPLSEDRLNSDFECTIWPGKRFENLVHLFKLKIAQHPELKNKLKDTGDKFIAGTSSDRIFGIGFSEQDSEALDRERWGDNLAGEAWMRVRDEV